MAKSHPRFGLMLDRRENWKSGRDFGSMHCCLSMGGSLGRESHLLYRQDLRSTILTSGIGSGKKITFATAECTGSCASSCSVSPKLIKSSLHRSASSYWVTMFQTIQAEKWDLFTYRISWQPRSYLILQSRTALIAWGTANTQLAADSRWLGRHRL